MIRSSRYVFRKKEKERSFRSCILPLSGSEEDVLHDISFTAEPGKTTAFIGSTGCGKSTLVNLIPRFYDVTDGKITIDRKDVRDVSQHELREKLGYVRRKLYCSPVILLRIFYMATRMEVKLR